MSESTCCPWCGRKLPPSKYRPRKHCTAKKCRQRREREYKSRRYHAMKQSTWYAPTPAPTAPEGGA